MSGTGGPPEGPRDPHQVLEEAMARIAVLEQEARARAEALAAPTPSMGINNPTPSHRPRLEGNAWKNVTTFVNLHKTDGTPDILVSYLEKIYGDPNSTERAARGLMQLRQGEKQSFAKFLPLLEKSFAEAGAMDWPDQAKRPLLLSALNSTMMTALTNRGIPKTFMEIVERLHDISTDLDTAANMRRGTYRPSGARPSRQNDEVYGPMDIEPPETRIGSTRARNSSGYPSKHPEDKILLGKRAKWVDKEVMDKRKEEGRCLRCGRDRCSIRRCPLKPARRPDRTPSRSPSPKSKTKVSRARPEVKEAAYEDDDDSDNAPSDESENA